MIENKDFEALGYPADVPANKGGGEDGLGGLAADDGPSERSGLEDEIASLRASPAYLDPENSDPAGHKALVEQIHTLTEKKLAGQPSKTEKMFANFKAEQTAKQDAAYDAAMVDYNWLGEAGFESVAEVPETIPSHLAEGWRQQRWLEEDKFAEFGDSLEKSLGELEKLGKLPSGKINAMREIITVQGVNPGLKVPIKRVADALLRLVYAAYELKI